MADVRLSLGHRLCKMPEGDPPLYITLDAQNTPNSHQPTRSCSFECAARTRRQHNTKGFEHPADLVVQAGTHTDQLTARSKKQSDFEAPRDFRRLQFLRKWSYGKHQEEVPKVLAGSS